MRSHSSTPANLKALLLAGTVLSLSSTTTAQTSSESGGPVFSATATPVPSEPAPGTVGPSAIPVPDPDRVTTSSELPVVTSFISITARQVPPTVTVTGVAGFGVGIGGDGINKADHSGPGGDHDDDSKKFRSGVESFASKATSFVGGVFGPDSTTGTGTATGTGTGTAGAAKATGTGKNAAGQVAVPGRGWGVGVLMAGLAGLVGAGVLLL